MPATITRWVVFLGWASLSSQILLIATGGAVRLTGSGLGCPTWPRCTDDSFVSTPEMGIHGIIEFGNRTLTFLLVIIAILTFLSVLNMRMSRMDLVLIAFFQGLGIPAQAVLGGITVLTGLNPYVVGLHFVVSIVLVALMTVYVYRIYFGARTFMLRVPAWYLALAHTASLALAVTIVVGILNTGSGPHAGDAATPRNGLDTELLQHIHSWPAYALLVLTIALLALAHAKGYPKRFLWILLAVECAQITVGLAQANLGIPAILVGIHMVLSAAATAALVAVILELRESTGSVPLRTEAADQSRWPETAV